MSRVRHLPALIASVFAWSWAPACNSNSLPDPGCLHSELDDWCFHDEASNGPIDMGDAEVSCEMPTFVPEPRATRCGDVDVTPTMSGGFTSTTQYFDHDSGELIAVRYGTDINTYCGGFVYWYGRRVQDCDADCSYDPASTDLPVCD